jgi:hypothetical protein
MGVVEVAALFLASMASEGRNMPHSCKQLHLRVLHDARQSAIDRCSLQRNQWLIQAYSSHMPLKVALQTRLSCSCDPALEVKSCSFHSTLKLTAQHSRRFVLWMSAKLNASPRPATARLSRCDMRRVLSAPLFSIGMDKLTCIESNEVCMYKQEKASGDAQPTAKIDSTEARKEDERGSEDLPS